MFLHIDIDSFFASAERTLNPDLTEVPIAVGSRSNLEIFNKKRTRIRLMDDNSGAFVAPVFYSDREKSFESYFVDEIDGKRKIRGIITTASYEARAYGVKTGMPIAQALSLCPKLIVIPANYPLYHRLSHRLHQFMQAHIPLVEQYSIDEFFADLSGWVKDKEVAAFAQRLQQQIKREYGLPVSIGISRAKWIAKLATESAKPYGIYEVKDIDAYIEHIPIEAFPGIGRGFGRRLQAHYIKTLGDVRRNRDLLYSWKKPGIRLYHRVTGTCNEGIEQRNDRKSIGISRTFDPIYNEDEIRRRIMIMARHIAYMAMNIEANPTLYYLKINYESGQRAKGTATVDRLFSEILFKEILLRLYDRIALQNIGVTKLTLNISNFTSHSHKTLSLLEYDRDLKAHRLSRQIHSARARFGLDILKTANEL